MSVVSRGGSLLLNVAPGPDGQLDTTAYVRLKEVGEWLKVNGEAVYGTQASAQPALSGVLGRTHTRRIGERWTTYIILDPRVIGSGTVTVPLSDSAYGEKVSCLGSFGKVRYARSPEALTLRLPGSAKKIDVPPLVVKVTYLLSEF